MDNIEHKLTSPFDSSLSSLPVFLDSMNFPIRLVIIIQENGCEATIIREIVILNSIYKKYNSFINIYLVSDSENNELDRLGANFDYNKIELDTLRLNKSFINSGPIALLVDKNGTIQNIHKTDIDSSNERLQFYEQMISLFDSFITSPQ